MLSVVISSHLIQQETIFLAAKFFLDYFNEFFILFTYVSKISVGGISSFDFNAMSWFVLHLFGVVAVAFPWIPLASHKKTSSLRVLFL